ncbi:MAG: sirohydrochlorin chelatase [bacterium]|nr:sirohydrochlorin chelatase [bacterium]
MAGIGYLLVGHGTRRESGQQQFRRLFEQFERELAPQRCEMAFLELAEPSIEDAMRCLATRGVEWVVCVPVLLFSAGHALEDIPQELERSASDHGLRVLGQTPSLESAPSVLALSAMRFQEAVCGRQAGASCAFDRGQIDCQNCSRSFCEETALTMVGRGSSSPDATRRMRAFTGSRCALTPVPWAQTAFIHAQQPDVPRALDWLQAAPYRQKVVQPHLLFEGLLMDQLREQVAERQLQDGTSRWVITEPLGSDYRLGKTLANLACKQIEANPFAEKGV